MSPLSRILATVVGLLVLAGAFFFGLIILAVAIGLGALAWIIFRIRLWWLQRKMPSSQGADPIDAEYTIISREDPPA